MPGCPAAYRVPVASWVIILRKKRVLDRAEKEADRFEETFWSGAELPNRRGIALEQGVFRFGVERRRRLVEDDEIGIERDRPREGHAVDAADLEPGLADRARLDRDDDGPAAARVRCIISVKRWNR